MEQFVSIPSGDVTLEGALTITGNAAPVVIACHPHPHYGGSMYNNVVEALRDELSSRGFSVLRFNFRGIGKSGGASIGGLDDYRDVSAAARFLKHHESTKGRPLLMAGYSYGAWVGIRHALDDRDILAWAAVSPPVSMFDFSYLTDPGVPVCFVSGDRDDFCDLESLRNMFEELLGQKRLEVVPGADHFYMGYEGQMARLVGQFFSDMFPS
ncbi:MAG: alpha/beta fold hydrolase [Deltaproteobacteria bacterium]|nr:alpha/beta fold hydrolase [Candidatus Zymogenaceae bacterium]